MLTGDSSYGYIGGESVQHVLLARAWRDLGLDVSIVVHDHGQPHVATLDGIRAITSYRKGEGIRMVRFFHPRLSSVVRAMREADADVYYQSPAGAWSGVAVWYAKQVGKPSIVRIAGDNDCRRGQQPMRHRRDRWLFDYAIRNASVLAAQTEKQRGLLLQHYAVHSEILNIAADTADSGAARSKDINVLWVGNPRPVKRPDILLEVARRLPNCRFAIVGGNVPGGEAYFERIAAEAKALPNVVMTGAVPYDEVGSWFERSRIHVNTSDSEGFPNTFLQAWIRSVPVVSFFDPDGLIERRDLGRRCVDTDDMCTAIEQLLRNPAASAAIGERAQAFVSSQYSARHIALQYLELLERRRASPLESKLDDRSIGAAREH